MVELTAYNFEIDPPGTGIKEWWQAMLHIQGTVAVRIDGETLLKAPHWCVVELVHALNAWESTSNWNADFVYESMDDEEPELLWFRSAGTGEWIIGSALQLKEAMKPVKTESLHSAVQAYKQMVEKTAEEELGVNLRAFSEFAG